MNGCRMDCFAVPFLDDSSAMANNMKLLERFEDEDRDSVEPVEEDLMHQVGNGECVAIRGNEPDGESLGWDESNVCEVCTSNGWES